MNGRMEYGRKRCGLCGINGFNIDKISLLYFGVMEKKKYEQIHFS